ncbi:MAG TPA: 16S rRNA (cytosine(967)-C(5))-methyltransferase RsmB [Abditibacteriaceae bacterium]
MTNLHLNNMHPNNIHPKTIARRAALQALIAVESEDAPLTSALDKAMRAADVSSQARPFAREIVSGVLRQQSRIDWTLEPLLKKPLGKLDAPVRAALRLAAYERAWLATPLSAVANEYAGLMKPLRLASATGFVNAIARQLPGQPRAVPHDWPVAQRLSLEFSHPLWMVERWLAVLGENECAAVCEANNEIAPLHLRVNSLQSKPSEVLATLKASGLNARTGHWSPDAIVIEAAGSPLDWPSWKAGHIIAQDEAAQLVGLFACPAPGNLVIDCAAAPGGKTTHLAQLMGDEGLIIACDAAPGRVKLVEENARRLGLSCIAARTGDLRALSNALPQADLVLLDAPCSGTGTLRRRPDAKHRKTPEQLTQLAQLQAELLKAAASLVKPDGILIYSTCSLETEENQGQIERFLKENPSWRVAPAMENPGALPAATIEAVGTLEGFLQTWPHRHGCDGMFAAKLRMKAEG